MSDPMLSEQAKSSVMAKSLPCNPNLCKVWLSPLPPFRGSGLVCLCQKVDQRSIERSQHLLASMDSLAPIALGVFFY